MYIKNNVGPRTVPWGFHRGPKIDLDALQEWERTWHMPFHPEKCQVTHICTDKKFRRHPTYKLHMATLSNLWRLQSTLIGVTLSEDL